MQQVEDVITSIRQGKPPSEELRSGLRRLNAVIAQYDAKRGVRAVKTAPENLEDVVASVTEIGNRNHYKAEAFQELAARSSVNLVLDARKADVPAHLQREPRLILEIGYSMAVPIRDLVVDDSGIVATLSFNRSPYRCEIPWQAVYAMGNSYGNAAWPEDAPNEVRPEPPAA